MTTPATPTTPNPRAASTAESTLGQLVDSMGNLIDRLSQIEDRAILLRTQLAQAHADSHAIVSELKRQRQENNRLRALLDSTLAGG